MIQIKNKHLFLAILIAFSGLFFFGWHLGSRKVKNVLKPTVDSLKYELATTKLKLGEKTLYVTKVESYLRTEKQLRRADEEIIKILRASNAKKADDITKMQLKIDTLLKKVEHTGIVVNPDTAVNEGWWGDSNVMILPFDFEKKDNWLDLKGGVDNDGNIDVNLQMAVGISLITGVDKDKKPFATLSTDNPYITPLVLNSYQNVPPKKPKFSVGIVFGYGMILNKEPQLSPYIGVGVSRNLFTF